MRSDGWLVTISPLYTNPGAEGYGLQFDAAVLDPQYAQMIAESIPHIVWTASPEGATTYFNRLGTDYTGCPRETNYEWNWVTLVHPDDAERAAQAWRHAAMTGSDFASEYRIRRSDGVFRWHAARAVPVRDAAGAIALWIGTATDVDDQKRLELNLRRAEREATEAVTLLESVEVATPVGFKLVDRDLKVVRINRTLAAVDARSVEECVGLSASELAPDLWPLLEDVYRRALTGETVSNIEVSKPHAADPLRLRHWLASYYPVHVDGEIIGVGNVVVDITEQKEAEEFRAVVMDNMVEGLYALDAAGLVTYMNPAAASMLGWSEQELLGKSMHDTVHFQRADGTKVSAEECALLQVRTRGQSIRILDDAYTRKDGSILPVAYSSAPLRSGQTVQGVVVVFRDITDEKRARSSAQRELDALAWIGRIRDAIDENRLVLYSQPVVPLAAGRLGEELLLRMIGRDNEVILPGSFLPVAEKYGMMAEIDRWVITQATRRAATGQRVVKANLSAASIGSSDLLPFVEQQLREAGTDPANLVFEITETSLMHDISAGESFARGLAALGCGLALDDFGTGFGGFTYLKKLPLTHLKIDTEFVRDAVTNPDNLHVIKAIVNLARAFGLTTIAEGVENEETLTLMRGEGIDFAQGFYLGRPEPLDDVRRIVAPPPQSVSDTRFCGAEGRPTGSTGLQRPKMSSAAPTLVRGAAVRVGAAEYPCDGLVMMDDQMVGVVRPPNLGASAGDLLGAAVQLRWYTTAGVMRADGTLAAIDESAQWIVHLTSSPRQVEERRFRRVAVQVDADLTSLQHDREVRSRTRSLNLSLGGAALVKPDGCQFARGDVVVVAIDPIASRILTGAVVVAETPGGLHLRFDSISGTSEDQLVALINRHELKLAR